MKLGTSNKINTKNFIIGGVVGGMVYFFLRWLIYGVLISTQYPPSGDAGLISILLGSLTIGFLITFLFQKYKQITTPLTAFRSGLKLGVFFGLINVFFQNTDLFSAEIPMMVWEILITIIVTSFTAGAIGFVLHKLEKE
jgi:putative flippase GtrA